MAMHSNSTVGLATVTLLVLYLYYNLKNDASRNLVVKNDSSLEKFSQNSMPKSVQDFRKCILENSNNVLQNKNSFLYTLRRCLFLHMRIKPEVFDFFQMGRFGERKYFLPMLQKYPQEECLWLTVGIGGDANVEKEFKLRYPKCQVFGVEPSPDQYANFEMYGKVIPHGVGIEHKEFPLTIRENHNGEDIYVTKNITVMPMESLLDNYLKSRLVHYMTIDIEGFEYPILQELAPSGVLNQKNVQFCQIDAELHENAITGNNSNFNFEKFLKSLIISPSPYIPIFNTPFLVHQKVTFINILEPECERAFGFSRYFN